VGRRSIGLKGIDADFCGRVQIIPWFRVKRGHVAARALGFGVENALASSGRVLIEAARRRGWSRDGQLVKVKGCQFRGDAVGRPARIGGTALRGDRILESTELTAVPYEEILNHLQQNGDALHGIFEAICRALSSAYDQVSLLSSGGTLERLVKVLLRLAKQFGRSSGDLIEVDAYLTQEEISQMMASSRERVSVALNLLRDRAMVQYSRRGHLLLDVNALEHWHR
jgi:CRP-like cAMP-binding protein